MRRVRDAGVRPAGAQLEQPDWGGDGGENPEKDPRGVSESERRGEETTQRIGEAPAGVTEGEMRRVNVRPFLACAVRSEELVPAKAGNAKQSQP